VNEEKVEGKRWIADENLSEGTKSEQEKGGKSLCPINGWIEGTREARVRKKM